MIMEPNPLAHILRKDRKVNEIHMIEEPKELRVIMVIQAVWVYVVIVCMATSPD